MRCSTKKIWHTLTLHKNPTRKRVSKSTPISPNIPKTRRSSRLATKTPKKITNKSQNNSSVDSTKKKEANKAKIKAPVKRRTNISKKSKSQATTLSPATQRVHTTLKTYSQDSIGVIMGPTTNVFLEQARKRIQEHDKQMIKLSQTPLPTHGKTLGGKGLLYSNRSENTQFFLRGFGGIV